MKRSFTFLFLIIFIPFNAPAQECSCPESFEWVVETFKNNDAGFQYVFDKKGEDDYEKHTSVYKEKAQTASNLNGCQDVISGWLKYFCRNHIGISIKGSGGSVAEISDEEIRLRYKDEKTIDQTKKQLIKALEKKKNKNPIEGIWTNNVYTIGVIADPKSTKKFTGFIIKADSIYWVPKQVKAEFLLNEENETYSVDFYMQNHSKQVTQAHFLNESKNLLSLIGDYWERIYPAVEFTASEKLMLSFTKRREPFIEKINDQTVYLRIPSFAANQKKSIDSVLAVHDNLIKSTPNLIIDIRNGTGGSDASYSKILPYLYTNPIRTVGVQLYATELNALAFEKYAKQYEDTSNINYCLRVAEKMRTSSGQFITLSDQIYYLETFDEVLPFPRKVGIICNRNNGSTDEQFLLDAKQSRKVKVFGRPTGGMLDISNMNRVDSPDGNFSLGYCMSKSFRIPHFSIDDVGIQADYFIDDAVSETEWIEYARSVLEEQ